MFSVTSESAIDLHKILPAWTFTVGQNPMTGAFYLQRVKDYVFKNKIYGDTLRNTQRILSTFDLRANATGVMLTGEQGSGKTLLATMLSIVGREEGIPTIVINEPWHGEGFNAFIQSIEQKAIVIFDEFEKVYDKETQEKMLTLFDGVYPSKKLFIITCNDKYRVNDHMKNRPGRFFYRLEFKGLESEFIEEYCQDNLENKDYIDSICRIALLFGEFTFDMLKAMVEEMNRYGESPQEVMKVLNAKPEYSESVPYDIVLAVNGKRIPESKLYNPTWTGNPLSGTLKIMYQGKPDKDGDWEYVQQKFTTEDLKNIDTESGKFIFDNGKGAQLSLQKKKPVHSNWEVLV